MSDKPTPRTCRDCGHPENNHPYRHMFRPMGFQKPTQSPEAGLPEGCPEMMMWGFWSCHHKQHGLFADAAMHHSQSDVCVDDCNRWKCTPVEIHPIGTRDRLASLTAPGVGEGSVPLEVVAKRVAKAIFDFCHEDESIERPRRMEYKLGEPGNERGFGGLNEFAMGNVIADAIHALSPATTKKEGE